MRLSPCVLLRALALASAMVVREAAAQSAAVAPLTRPVFTPDHADGFYARGERVGWTVSLPASAPAAARRTIRYVIYRNGADSIGAGTIALGPGRARMETALAEPGMVLVEVRPVVADSTFGDVHTGGAGRIRLAATVDPAHIEAAEPAPTDFGAFWAAKIARLDSVPLASVVRTTPSEREGVTLEVVKVQNVGGAHVHGQLAHPDRPGTFPGLVIFQWASPPYPLQKAWVTDHAARGWLAFNVEPHDVPPDMPPAFYEALPAMIKNYPAINQGSRDESYFVQMYLGAYRALQYLRTRPEWDGRTLVVLGTSMGGQQSLAVAGLDTTVTALIVNVPSGGDVTAALHARWPSYPFWPVRRPEVLATARYFDTANFAERIRARALIAMGFIDDVSAPAGIWAVHNRIRGPKAVAPMMDTPHNHQATPAQLAPWRTASQAWLDALVQGRDPMALPDSVRGRRVR